MSQYSEAQKSTPTHVKVLWFYSLGVSVGDDYGASVSPLPTVRCQGRSIEERKPVWKLVDWILWRDKIIRSLCVCLFGSMSLERFPYPAPCFDKNTRFSVNTEFDASSQITSKRFWTVAVRSNPMSVHRN
jgi:hypothetical protein